MFTHFDTNVSFANLRTGIDKCSKSAFGRKHVTLRLGDKRREVEAADFDTDKLRVNHKW